MGKRKYRQIITCLLSATLIGSSICSSIVFASETPSASAKIRDLNESSIFIEDTKGETEPVNQIGDSQVKTTISSNQEVNEIQPFVDNNYAGDFNVIGDTNGWAYDNDANTLTFTASGEYIVTGDGTATTEQIIVSGNDIEATITLNNVNIDVSTQMYNQAFYAKSSDQSNVHLTIILQGKNTLKSGHGCAAITWNNTDDKSILEIKGEGSLTATGGNNGAGIGGGRFESGNDITITGGTIITKGGDGGAGIGGGANGSGNNIRITGGTVTATGGNSGTGIGGGANGSGNSIRITGGTVTATGRGGGAGIGGSSTGSGNNITILGGTVIATGRDGGAGIGGGGMDGPGSYITISGGIVTATGENGGAGIGGGMNGSGSYITISDGTVTATGENGGAGIGGGMNGLGSYITISDGTVTATGEYGGAGIGGGNFGSGSNITIKGGSVKASSIDSTPMYDKNTPIYPVKLENQDNVNEVIVDNQKKITRKGSHPNNDTAFYLYLTGVDHDLQIGSKYYKAFYTSGNFTIKTALKPNKPTVTMDSSKTTASSITITELADKDTYGGAEYSIDNINWQTSNIFTGLHSNKEYNVYARYKGNDTYVVSDTGTDQVSTFKASYTITIPANPDNSLVAGKGDSVSTISVNQNEPFDLGHNGKINVKIKNDNNVVTEDAKLKLTRQNDTENHTITSALLVNGTALGNINENVAVFTISNKEPVSVSFAKPTESNILAGTYKGTITFEVSYSEQ